VSESIQQLISADLQFEVVMGRLKAALGLRSFAELARLLGLSTSGYANRKKGSSIPFGAVIELAASRHVSLDWLFRGVGDAKTDGSKVPSPPPAAVDPLVFGWILKELESAFGLALHGKVEVSSVQHAAVLGMLAGQIYNEVVHIPAEKVRNMMIRDRAEQSTYFARYDRVAKEICGDVTEDPANGKT
jgi:hypothetical protein